MKTRHVLTVALPTLALICLAMKPARLKVNNEKQNVVSGRLEGKWQPQVPLTKRLVGDVFQPSTSTPDDVSFRTEQSVVQTIPEKYEEFLKETTIYMAGIMTRHNKDYPFILIELFGNPHIVYFRERDADPMGDAESFNVMLASAKDKTNDLLFIGGDFSNEPFSAYQRAKEPNDLTERGTAVSNASGQEPELLKYYSGNEKMPDRLYDTYSRLVNAIETGDQGDINRFCLPHSITFTTEQRPQQHREYGQSMNIPFLKKGFDKYIRNLRNDAQGCYLIRTNSSAMWFTQTGQMHWRLYRYLDKPIE